jgi:sporulation protein YlmC with PRC-barrel domain
VFTDQLGRAVRRDGTRIGKVDDLIVVLGETDPYVVALRVRVGRRGRRRVPWSAVASFSEEVVITADPIEDELAGDELLLARDVLDTQIFEFGGRRLTRVADIELVWRDRELRLVGVDIGAAPLLRRLGLGVFARRAASKVIPWNELHLTSVRGHTVQLDAPTSRVYTLTTRSLQSSVHGSRPTRDHVSTLGSDRMRRPGHESSRPAFGVCRCGREPRSRRGNPLRLRPGCGRHLGARPTRFVPSGGARLLAHVDAPRDLYRRGVRDGAGLGSRRPGSARAERACDASWSPRYHGDRRNDLAPWGLAFIES